MPDSDPRPHSMPGLLLVAALLAGGPPSALAAEAAELAGSGWRLLKIMSMDDSVYQPEDPERYTLELGADGRASIAAGCNRGTGEWTSEQPGQLRFGPIASTRALCAPGSISERYLGQFEWIRSYVMRDGHLFLATMADGAIIEFEPMPPAVATVLGEQIRGVDPSAAQSEILSRLFEAYASAEGIAATDAEIAAFIDDLHRGKREMGLDAAEELTPEEAAELATMERGMARSMIEQWKLNQSLYRRYGGRIIFQQFGLEPLDAYREHLEERQEAGDFELLDTAVEKQFWRYFRDDSIHSFVEPGSEEERRAFSIPPWKRSP